MDEMVTAFVEEECHDDGRHDRIGEEDGGRHTGIHQMETEIEREGRDGEEQSQSQQHPQLAAGDTEGFMPEKQYDADDYPRQPKTVEED